MMIDALLQKVKGELLETERELGGNAKFNSEHEGYAVLLEEMEELWDAIKSGHSLQHKRGEAIQIAAMAIRFVLDLCPPAVVEGE